MENEELEQIPSETYSDTSLDTATSEVSVEIPIVDVPMDAPAIENPISVEPAHQYASVYKDESQITDEDFRWYCIRTFTGYEEKVLKTAQAEVKRLNLEYCVKDIMIPLETVFEVRNGKKKTKIRNFLPGYIMLNAVISDQKRTKNKILDGIGMITGVVAFVGRKNDPAPLQPWEVDKIFARINERKDIATIDTTYRSGDPIKVIIGPFTGFSGTIMEVSNEMRKMKVEIVILGRKTPVELDYDQVQFDKPE
jgi:transcriptional antiterminator NusG